jgi:hypothetical protein
LHTSVVISARSGSKPVLSALASLARLPQYSQLDVVIANCCGAATEEEIIQSYPGVKVITLPPQTSIAQSRHAATQKASGEIVAVLHERYHVPENWINLLERAHETKKAEVVGGCVSPSSRMSAAQWAMYLTEYTHASPPLPTGPLDRRSAEMVPGGNVSYKRAAFQRVSMAGYMWELDFHSALFDRGGTFYRDGAIIAQFGHPFTVHEYAAERFEISRDFAARRAVDMPVTARIVSAAVRLVLPPVVIARVAAAVLKRKAYVRRFVFALPWIATFSIVQTWGEIYGYLTAAGRAEAATPGTP